jgi:hypothetical protein
MEKNLASLHLLAVNPTKQTYHKIPSLKKDSFPCQHSNQIQAQVP